MKTNTIKQNQRIEVKQILGENCMSVKQGEALYDMIHPLLMDGEALVLDFAGVRIFASPFFNHAIGRLLKTIAPNKLNTLLDFDNLSDVGSNTLELVIENAQLYYSDSGYSDIKDETIREMAISL